MDMGYTVDYSAPVDTYEDDIADQVCICSGYVFFNFIGLLLRLTRTMIPPSSSLVLVAVTTMAKLTGMATAPTQTPATDYTTIWRSATTVTTAGTTRRGSTPWRSESLVTVSYKCIIQSILCTAHPLNCSNIRFKPCILTFLIYVLQNHDDNLKR